MKWYLKTENLNYISFIHLIQFFVCYGNHNVFTEWNCRSSLFYGSKRAAGHLTPKSDVYSFGVVLLELLTGRRAMDDERAGSVEETLVDWAKPFLSDTKRVLRIMDTRLGGQYPKKAAQTAAELTLQCLHTDPKYRPLMIDVLATLERLHTKNTLRTQPHKPEHHGAKHLNHPHRITNSNTKLEWVLFSSFTEATFLQIYICSTNVLSRDLVYEKMMTHYSYTCFVSSEIVHYTCFW